MIRIQYRSYGLFMNLKPLYIFLPWLQFVDEVACVVPDKCFEVCESHAGCSNIAYPKLFIMREGILFLLLLNKENNSEQAWNNENITPTIGYKPRRIQPCSRWTKWMKSENSNLTLTSMDNVLCR